MTTRFFIPLRVMLSDSEASGQEYALKLGIIGNARVDASLRSA